MNYMGWKDKARAKMGCQMWLDVAVLEYDDPGLLYYDVFQPELLRYGDARMQFEEQREYVWDVWLNAASAVYNEPLFAAENQWWADRFYALLETMEREFARNWAHIEAQKTPA